MGRCPLPQGQRAIKIKSSPKRIDFSPTRLINNPSRQKDRPEYESRSWADGVSNPSEALWLQILYFLLV